ncbi:MAG TPA: HPF/RaiA family ribosome-associated protein [Candidatus Binataceae bacterium]|nr:HPF/RaiA family ribosome-associated protein [Candidatus Binataceae bacterium]
MQRPLKILSRDFTLSPGIEAEIRDKVAALEHFYNRITGCEVVIEGTVHHHRHGGPFRVRIHLTVPGDEIAINRQAEDDLAVAVRESFAAARRRIEDHIREVRGDVKAHDTAPHGVVKKLFPSEGYGFLLTPEGDEVYFHRNSVLHPGFDQLAIGALVRFNQELGENGPQASTVAMLNPHRERRRAEE